MSDLAQRLWKILSIDKFTGTEREANRVMFVLPKVSVGPSPVTYAV